MFLEEMKTKMERVIVLRVKRETITGNTIPIRETYS